VFESPEAVEDEGFSGRRPGAELLVEEQAVTAEAFGLALEGAVGDAELAADLAQARAADEAMEEGFEEPGVSQPVGGREGLRTEVPAAVVTLVTLDLVWAMDSKVEPFLFETPRG